MKVKTNFNKFARSIPYLNLLLKTTPTKRTMFFKSFPKFVIDDILEILHNIVLGNVKISATRKNALKNIETHC
jgi:hypothetical protein